MVLFSGPQVREARGLRYQGVALGGEADQGEVVPRKTCLGRQLKQRVPRCVSI